MAKDALLSLTGPADEPGNAIEASAVTGDADGTKGYVYVGKYRAGVLEVRINGAFDRTTGDEELTAEVWEADDASGTNAALIASSTPITASNMADTDESGTVTLGLPPYRVGFMTGDGGWIKYRSEFGASTTPSATGLSADVIMTADAFRQSGT